MLGSREILYESEAAISNLSCERIYPKKAVEYNPRLISRFCYLRGYPSYLLKLIKGAVVDMDDSDPVSILESGSQDIKPWDRDSWTTDLGTSSLSNGIAQVFQFVPGSDQPAYLVAVMAFLGPMIVMLTRHRTIDTKQSLIRMLRERPEMVVKVEHK